MTKEKIVLAYSGGLDTSVAIAWLKNKGYDVIACCIDVGEGKDLEAIKEKGKQVGAWKSVVIDAKHDFAEQFVLPALQAHAMYEQKYPLVSALSRPLIVQNWWLLPVNMTLLQLPMAVLVRGTIKFVLKPVFMPLLQK